jgi:hypothetical protein
VIHEANTLGLTYHRGNVQETAQFISTLYRAYLWGGDRAALLRSHAFVLNALAWLRAQDSDGDGWLEGAGVVEIPILDGGAATLVDVNVHFHQALAAAAAIARELGDAGRAAELSAEAAILAGRLNAEWWVGQWDSYGDVRTSARRGAQMLQQALERTERLGGRREWALGELRQRCARKCMHASATGRRTEVRRQARLLLQRFRRFRPQGLIRRVEGERWPARVATVGGRTIAQGV